MLADLEWVASASNHLQELRAAPPHAWFKFLQDNGATALASIRAAMMADLAEKVAREAELIGIVPPHQLGAIWECGECGDTFICRSKWAVHMAREHGEKRIARQFVLGSECPVCRRVFANRQKLLNHLHAASPICLVNLVLAHPRAEPDEVAEADRAMAEDEQRLRASGDHPAYSLVLAKQLPGPVRRIVIPLGHSRRSTTPLFRRGIKCHKFAREVDFTRLRMMLGIDPVDLSLEDDDDLPLDIMEMVWG